MIVALLAPAAALVVMVLWTMGGGDVDTLVRLLMMGLAYLVYFVTFGALTQAHGWSCENVQGSSFTQSGVVPAISCKASAC